MDKNTFGSNKIKSELEKSENVEVGGWGDSGKVSSPDSVDVSAWGSVSAPSASWNSSSAWVGPEKSDSEKLSESKKEPFEISSWGTKSEQVESWGSGTGTESWKPIDSWSPAIENEKSESHQEDVGMTKDDEVTTSLTFILRFCDNGTFYI